MTTTTALGYTSNPKLCVINYYAYFLYLGNLYNVTALYIDCSRVRRRLSARSATAYYRVIGLVLRHFRLTIFHD